MAQRGPFPFVQFEFGYLLGPADGRYLARAAGSDEPHAVLVLTTLGAPRRHRLRGRRGRRVKQADPEPVPISRATVVRAAPLESRTAAETWLRRMRGDERDREVARAAAELNRLLRAYRIAAGDHSVRDVAPAGAIAVRVGYGSGEEVAEGRYADAVELPKAPPRRRRAERLSPQERTAELVGGRSQAPACAELILRARADVDARHWREAALQARIALECLLAELPANRTGAAAGHRDTVGAAANAALDGELAEPQRKAVTEAVGELERALRRSPTAPT
jgi:hypothetical protein